MASGHSHDPGRGSPGSSGPAAINRLALSATLHCLAGCAIGEILGLVFGTALGWDAAPTIVLAVALAFLFGYGLTMAPLLRAGLTFAAAVRVALAANTLSIAVMELVDNAIALAIPGAMAAPLSSAAFWFWLSLGVALAVAGVVAFPVNRWLIRRGKGHAAARHDHHA